MEEFKYYKRGQGELDTSNFPEICRQGMIVVDKLDSKTFVSLLALHHYIGEKPTRCPNRLLVTVRGYVDHLRGDKDEFFVAKLYDLLYNLQFSCHSVQHTSTGTIKTSKLSTYQVVSELRIPPTVTTQLLGCDGSVNDFMYFKIPSATKVRENGKVTKLSFAGSFLDTVDHYVLVDDILGGGATVQMFYDFLRAKVPDKPISLWVRYNEGIHPPEFLDQFESYYLGDLI